MSRWLLAGCILLLLVIASVYVFIPSQLVVSRIVPIKCNVTAADRQLGDTAGWTKWWPQGATGVGYSMSRRLRRSAEVTMDDHGTEIPSLLTVFPLSNIDSSYLIWQFTLQTSVNPFKRIGQYQQARRLKDNISAVLSSFQAFLEKQQNVYGLTTAEFSVKGSQVEEITQVIGQYPLTDTIYAQVGKLEQFLAAHGASITGPPMVNITPLPDEQFKLAVALPTDKEIPASGSFASRNLPTDIYLQADVYGGDRAVHAALGRLADYVSDHHRTIMAKPFSSLITDRRTVRDTTKWLTRLYYPLIPRN